MRIFKAIGMRMIYLLPFLLLSPVIAMAQGTDPGEWTRVDSIVATINGAPILETDVLMEMDLGLLGSSHLGADFGQLLEAYLNRLLILKEVEEVGGFRLIAGQSEGAYQGYLLRYASKEDYEKKLQMWGIDEEEVLEMLNRALLVSLYTESRIQFFVNILPSDIEKAYEEDQDRWGDATIYEVWESVRSELLQSTYRKERDRWLSTLKIRYDLIVYSLNGDLGK
ncbi:MAG: hypothetical protein RRA15_10315 [bacterium]|nr:hypothetical protein [bacterium]MDT8366870.1 hypothetical protein [bacterium]